MYKNFIKVLLLVVIQLSVVSCKNKEEKMSEFASYFNDAASQYTNEIVTGFHAEANIPKNEIHLIFETSLESDPTIKGLYDNTFPSIINNLIQSDNRSEELINEGVKFNVDFLAKDNTKISNFVIDKQKMAEIMKKELNVKPVVTSASTNPTLSPELQQMLTLMNKNMPIENKIDKTKILKIDVNNENQLVYNIEIPEDYAKILNSEAANSLMKEQILRSSDIKNIFSSIQHYGITGIRYDYENTKGKVLNSVILTEKDLR